MNISAGAAGKMNRMGAQRVIERKRAQAAGDQAGADPATATKWMVVKNVTVCFPTGAFRFRAGSVIEDPAVKYHAEAAGAELRPIA